MTTNLQLVEQPDEPERCAAENLKPGQFLAAGALTTGRPSEVLFTDTYAAHGGGRETLVVHRPLGCEWSVTSNVGGNHWFTLATEADLAAFRSNVERAQKIADIRALADWLEANPDVPLAPYPSEQVDLHDGAASVAFVRELAAKFGGQVRDDLDDRTQVYIKFGSFEYRVIAWHPDGRPVELRTDPYAGVPVSELPEYREGDPTGLAYTRADDEPDDPTPVSPARVPMHTGAMTDEGLVDETPGNAFADRLTAVLPEGDPLDDPGPCWHGEIAPGRECPGTGPDCGPA